MEVIKRKKEVYGVVAIFLCGVGDGEPHRDPLSMSIRQGEPIESREGTTHSINAETRLKSSWLHMSPPS